MGKNARVFYHISPTSNFFSTLFWEGIPIKLNIELLQIFSDGKLLLTCLSFALKVVPEVEAETVVKKTFSFVPISLVGARDTDSPSSHANQCTEHVSDV